jgi:hypothetical protein
MGRKNQMAYSDPKLLAESDSWDELTLGELLAESEPIEAVINDRRQPKKPISIRVEGNVLAETKEMAARLGLGYQTLFRIWLREGLTRYSRRVASRPRRGRQRTRPTA